MTKFQPVNDQLKKYVEIRKIATGEGDDYKTVCSLDYQYFRYHYHLIINYQLILANKTFRC